MFQNFFKLTSVVFFLLIFTNIASAQSVTDFNFAATSGSFTPLVGGTTMALSGGTVDDGWFNSIPIGFTFNYLGTPFTMVSTSTNGWLTFNQTLTTSTTFNNLTSGTTRPFIAPLWDDLDLQLNTNFSYQTSGSPGSQVFTAEWLNEQWNWQATGNTISFQVKLYEATGAVEFVYRDEGGTVNSGSASIGLTDLTGSGSGTFLSLDGTGANPTASSTTETTTLNTSPSTGQVYTFTPASILNPTGVSAIAMSTSQINVAFTPYAGNNVVIVFDLDGTFDTPSGTPPIPGQPFAGGTLIYNGISSPYSHTPLTSETTYFYKLFTYDGGTAYSSGVAVNATTWCDPIAPPLTEDFEGTTFPPACWANYGDKLWTSGSEAHSGLKAARVSYSPIGTANLQMPNVVLPATPNYRIKFWWKDDDITLRPGDGIEVIGHDTTFFEITTDGGTTWTGLDTLSEPSPASAYVEVVQSLSAYAGQTVSFRWRDYSDGTGSAWGVGLDDITIEEIPSCLEPNSLTATGITTTSAILGWTQPGSAASWDIEYGVVPFTPTGTPSISGVTNPYTLTTLTSATGYAYYVRANCGGGDFSSWAGPLNFQTPCDLVTALDENFDAVSTPNLPICWDKYVSPAYSFQTVETVTISPNSAPNCVRIYSSGATLPADAPMLVTPILSNLSSGLQQLRFAAKGASTNLSVIVGTMSDPANNATFTPFATITGLSTSTWTESIISFASYSGTDQYITFQHPLTTTYSYIYIDDVIWEPIPSCPAPISLTATGITSTSAILGWTETGSATSWDIEYGVLPFTPTGTPTISGVTNPYTLTTLTVSTGYAYYVRANCGSGDFGTWSGPLNFNTTQIPAPLPFAEGFEMWPNNWSVVNGTQTNQWWVGTATANSGSQSAYVSDDAGETNHYDSSITSNVHLYRDITFSGATGSGYNLSFWWKGLGESCCDYLKVFLVETSVVPTAGTQLTSGQIGVNYNMQDIYTQASIALPDTLTGYTMRLVFSWHNDSSIGEQPPASIDDISVIALTDPIFSISPTSGDFGDVGVGDSKSIDFIITNIGASILTITSGDITIGGTNSDQFSLGTIAYPINLGGGESDTISVSFAPTSAGAKDGEMQIVHNAAGSPATVTLTGTGYEAISAFTESFDDPTFPPANWTNAQVNGTGLWTYATTGAHPPECTPHSGAGMAEFASWSFTGGTSANLVTPAINFPGNYRVVFWMYRDDGYLTTPDRVLVHYSTTPDLTGATLLGTINRSIDLSPTVTAEGWYEYAFYVPAGSSGNTYIIFQAISGYGNDMYIDDVSVSLPLADDVGTYSIDVASNVLPGVVSPQATVFNFGTNTNSFNVQITIDTYTDIKTVTDLAPGTSEQVTFDNWTAALGDYTIDVCTQLGTDMFTNNDCLSQPVGVTYWTNGDVIPAAGITYMGSGAAIGGYLYSMGGNTLSLLNTECYKYEVATDTWFDMEPLPEGRGVFATAAVGNYIYAIGGYDLASVPQSTVFRYDIAGDVWTSVASLPIPIGWGKAVGYMGNYIYVAGGYDGTVVLSTVYVYDIAGDSWSTASPMLAARFGGAFSVTGNQLVYVAGVDLAVLYDDVYLGTIDGTDPLTIVWTSPVSKYPGTKKQTFSPHVENLASMMPGKIDKENGLDATYPPGAMFKFDAATWGTDGVIMAGGDPTAGWVPANPNPCYVYKPASDTWEQQGNVPIPILGASMGTVNNGSDWTLIVATGLTSTVETDATQLYSLTLGGGSTFALSVDIELGWNMVSIPGNTPAAGGNTIDNWWAFRTTTAPVYDYVPPYTGVTTVVPGTGYWMKHPDARTYNTGDEWPAAIDAVTHAVIPVTAGWNMFGGYEFTVPRSGLTTNPPGEITGIVYGYQSGYFTATDIVPGEGYWVKVTNGCDLIIPEPGPLAKGSGEVEEYFKADWGRIILTDALGRSNTLYAVNGEVNLDQYEMPPAPPAGMFDMRFGSGRIAEDINSSMQSIDMSGVTYPLTVRVEGMDIRLQDVTGSAVNVSLKSGEDVVIGDATIQKLMVTGELIPAVYALEQNYPNPFNPSTVIEFSLPEDVSNVKLSIYNALGEKVAEIVNSSLAAGKYQYQWNAQNVATGMYIYELRTDKFVSVKKMILLK